jgi:hypothetical protein
MAPNAAVGQTSSGETGSDDHVASVTEMVAAVSLALVAGPTAAAPTPAAFAAAIQVTVSQVQVDPRGEPQARAQLGNFRTSILMKAGVLSFGGTPAPSQPADVEAETQRPSWATWLLTNRPESTDPDITESDRQGKLEQPGRRSP